MDVDLQELLTAWMGGEIDPARLGPMLDRVRGDEAFRLAFIAEIHMLGRLKAVQSSEPRWLLLEDELGWSGRESNPCGAIEEGVARHVFANPPGRRTPLSRGWRLASAAALILAGLSITLATRGRPIPPPPAPAVPRNQATGLAMILRLEGVRWDPIGTPSPREGDVLGVSRLRFNSGRATLSMFTGVVIVVEGPADVELISVDQVYCRLGKLRTRVPKGAEGFVVSTAGSAVVDLGTEFAMNLTSEGRARGRVYEGRVEASVLGPSGTPQRTEVLHESKTFEINPGAGQVDKIEGSERFVEPPDLVAGPLALDPDYPRAVLDSRPWGYWRFEAMDGGVVPNQVAGGLKLRAVGPVRLAGTRENRGLEFVDDAAAQYLALDALWQPPGRPGYAVELWFLSRSIAHAALASLVTPADTNNHTFLLELTSRNRLVLHKPASVRFLHRLPAGPSGGDMTFTESYYVPYRWHHLVGQINGDLMETFLDGEPMPPLRIAPGRTTPAGQFLLGRLTTAPATDPGWSRHFRGRLDEVAIYNHPLEPGEIRRHYRLGSPREGRPE